MALHSVHPRQLDAIREVVNIGAGHAATALSTMTNLRVMISVPRIHWVEEADQASPALPGTGSPLVVISVPIVGAAEGGGEKASLILAKETALQMVAVMLRRDPPADGEMGLLERSALNEVGNIVCASYVGVLGSFLGKGVMIGTPEMYEIERGEMASQAANGLLIETDFAFLDATFEGVFVLSHAEISFASLLDALGLSNVA
jgi:chemotaxis protein CheC